MAFQIPLVFQFGSVISEPKMMKSEKAFTFLLYTFKMIFIVMLEFLCKNSLGLDFLHSLQMGFSLNVSCEVILQVAAIQNKRLWVI